MSYIKEQEIAFRAARLLVCTAFLAILFGVPTDKQVIYEDGGGKVQ
jgi:hypothetical protein